MDNFSLLGAIEQSENGFYSTYLLEKHDKLKAARRALFLLLSLRGPISESEQSGQPFDAVEQSFIELMAAVFSIGRAAFLLLMQGYIFPTQCLLRTLWEQVVFAEYFRLYPDECQEWADATGDDRNARTRSAEKAWGAIKAKGKQSVLGGKRGKVYQYLTRYTHSHRSSLFDLTSQVNEEQSATVFGPSYEPRNLEYVLDYYVSDLVSAVKVFETFFQSRIKSQGDESLDELLIELLILAGLIDP